MTTTYAYINPCSNYDYGPTPNLLTIDISREDLERWHRLQVFLIQEKACHIELEESPDYDLWELIDSEDDPEETYEVFLGNNYRLTEPDFRNYGAVIKVYANGTVNWLTPSKDDTSEIWQELVRLKDNIEETEILGQPL